MEIIRENTALKEDKKNSALILGFFDGVHKGHREVIKSAVDFAHENNKQSVLLTFKDSPAKYFGKKVEYIYPREYSYQIIESLDVDCLIEADFAQLAQTSAEVYLRENLITRFNPISISTGFNHTFGLNRGGDAEFLAENSNHYGYKYFCIQPCRINDNVVSSTKIREYLLSGDIESANMFLGADFVIESTVIKGAKLGRKIGFPTANMKYPIEIIKIPYGVYKVRANGMPAVLNWGVKPTVGDNSEILEVHIPNFNQDLYGKKIKIEFIKKIRDEKRFGSIEELVFQINKDVEECLK